MEWESKSTSFLRLLLPIRTETRRSCEKKKTKELLRSSINIKNWLRIRRKKTEKESKGDKRCCQRQSRKGVHRPRRHEQTPCSLSTSVESSRFFLTIDLICFNSFLAFNDQLTCYKVLIFQFNRYSFFYA